MVKKSGCFKNEKTNNLTYSDGKFFFFFIYNDNKKERYFRIIHEMDIQEPEFTSEQVRSVLFTQDAGNQCKSIFI